MFKRRKALSYKLYVFYVPSSQTILNIYSYLLQMVDTQHTVYKDILQLGVDKRTIRDNPRCRSDKGGKQMNYKVVDWAGNVMNFGTFKTFEDAWDFLMEKFENEEDLQEFEVVEA